MNEKVFNDGILKGRVAFVTGGGTGITGGIARALAEAGASVALTSRKIEHLQPAADAINASGGKAFAVVADVRQPEEVEKAVAQTIEQLGKIEDTLKVIVRALCLSLPGLTLRLTSVQVIAGRRW